VFSSSHFHPLVVCVFSSFKLIITHWFSCTSTLSSRVTTQRWQWPKTKMVTSKMLKSRLQSCSPQTIGNITVTTSTIYSLDPTLAFHNKNKKAWIWGADRLSLLRYPGCLFLNSHRSNPSELVDRRCWWRKNNYKKAVVSSQAVDPYRSAAPPPTSSSTSRRYFLCYHDNTITRS